MPSCPIPRRASPPQAQLLVSLVPYCRAEPDGSKCRELYELLSEFISKGNVDIRLLCKALPGLPPPPPLTPATATATASSMDVYGHSMDGPLPGPASAAELALMSTPVTLLSEAVAGDGNPALVEAVPLLVWLMRLIIEPRVTASDGHLSGLLGLARVIVRSLGPKGKEAVGLRGLRGIIGDGGGEGGGGKGLERGAGLLHHVYHDCLFDIATHDNHGPLAPPKSRSVFCSVFFVFLSRCLLPPPRRRLSRFVYIVQ